MIFKNNSYYYLRCKRTAMVSIRQNQIVNFWKTFRARKYSKLGIVVNFNIYDVFQTHRWKFRKYIIPKVSATIEYDSNNIICIFYIAILYELNHTLHCFTNYCYLRLYTSNPSAAKIPALYPRALGMLLGDVHLSEFER